MEMLVIAVIVVVAFAAVLIPLFRRRPGSGDELEFENIPPADTAEPAAVAPDRQHAPDEDVAGATATAAADRTAAPADHLEREVLRYRTAVRAGTVCRRCGQANPPESTYCAECGGRLQRADAKEFE